MFRFSIREILLLTTVVGLMIGWRIDHWQQDKEIRLGNLWRLRAGTLEQFVELRGWKVLWGKNTVTAIFPSGSSVSTRSLEEPSPIDD